MSRLLSLSAFLLAAAYIVYLRRALAAAQSRGDMYRDIAASLDQRRSVEAG
jgi:hypothetical protein